MKKFIGITSILLLYLSYMIDLGYVILVILTALSYNVIVGIIATCAIPISIFVMPIAEIITNKTCVLLCIALFDLFLKFIATKGMKLNE